MQAPAAEPPGRSSIFGAGWRGTFVSLAVLIVAFFAVDEGFKAATAPWAVSWMPGPKLVGTWEGPLQARQGAKYRVFLDLRYADERRPSRTGDNNLAGSARVCTQTGATLDYTIYGGISAFTQVANIGLTYGDPKLSGLGFGLKGPWNGAPLRLTASDNPFDPDGVYRRETPSSTADPDDSFLPVELTAASLADFERGCRELSTTR